MSVRSQFLVNSKASKRPDLLARADRDVAHRGMPGIWTSLGLLPILIFATNYAVAHPVTLGVFGAATVLLTLARLWLVLRQERMEPTRWRLYLAVIFGLTGLTWGAFVPVTFYIYGHNGIEGLLTLIWLAGSCPAVISILAPYLLPMRLYLVAAVVPGILGELFLIFDTQPAVATLLVVFLLYMMEFGSMAHSSYWKNLEDNDLLKKKAAELEIAMAEAENANRAKSELLAKVTDEIRNPLYDIIGLSAGLIEADGLPPEPVDQLRNMKFSADALLHRVTDLHDYALLESGEAQFEQQPFFLQEAVGMALRALKPAAEMKGLEFHAQIDEEVPRKVVGDPWRLQQLVSNLVSNAIKFTDEGEVTIDVRLESRHGENIVILFVVTDTGPGIAAEHQELVFQAFNRPDAAEAPGSGLGLPIASRIAGMTGGRVWIESEAGRGSKIYATIRLRADEEYSSKSRFQTLPVGA
jgi:signal transduction histidine kinase